MESFMDGSNKKAKECISILADCLTGKCIGAAVNG